MQMQGSVASHAGTPTRLIARRWPALAVLGFGLLMLYGVGFSTISAAHNAAHDTRHATGFPCH
jgi:cobalt transporter subunit CbtB